MRVDRRTTGGRGDRGYRSAPYTGGEQLKLRVLVDRGSVEVFVGDGAENLTSFSFPADGARSLALTSVAGTIRVESLVVHRLGSIWETPDLEPCGQEEMSGAHA